MKENIPPREERRRQKIAVGICEGLRPLVRLRYSWEDGITDISQINRALRRVTDSCGSEQTPVAGSCDFLEQWFL